MRHPSAAKAAGWREGSELSAPQASARINTVWFAVEACSPAVFVHTWYSASRPPDIRGRAGAQAACASMPAAAVILYFSHFFV
jgi:hypothetical protein